MEQLLKNLKFQISERFYLADPMGTDLGQRILSNGVDMLVDIGYDQFTFKKLSKKVNASEPAVYRYFENKQMLIHYLFAWYFRWIEAHLVFKNSNIEDPYTRLNNAFGLFIYPPDLDGDYQYIGGNKLYDLVDTELYVLTKSSVVTSDQEDKNMVPELKDVVKRLGSVISNCNGAAKYPETTALMLMQSIFYQRFLFKYNRVTAEDQPEEINKLQSYLTELILKVVKK